MLRSCKIVEKYEEEIPDLIVKIREDSTSSEEESSLVISTAHRAKGKEWGRVSLADDFFEIDPEEMNMNQLIEEINLLYVSVTRAREELSLCSSVQKLLEEDGGGESSRGRAQNTGEEAGSPAGKVNFKEGSDVKHREFGRGRVINIARSSKQNRVLLTVDFEEKGKKKLSRNVCLQNNLLDKI